MYSLLLSLLGNIYIEEKSTQMPRCIWKPSRNYRSINESIPACTFECFQQGTIFDGKVAKLWVLMPEVAVEKRKSRPRRSPPPPPPPAGSAARLAINNRESNAAVSNRGVVKALTSEPSAFQGCCNGLFFPPRRKPDPKHYVVFNKPKTSWSRKHFVSAVAEGRTRARRADGLRIEVHVVVVISENDKHGLLISNLHNFTVLLYNIGQITKRNHKNCIHSSLLDASGKCTKHPSSEIASEVFSIQRGALEREWIQLSCEFYLVTSLAASISEGRVLVTCVLWLVKKKQKKTRRSFSYLRMQVIVFFVKMMCSRAPGKHELCFSGMIYF